SQFHQNSTKTPPKFHRSRLVRHLTYWYASAAMSNKDKTQSDKQKVVDTPGIGVEPPLSPYRAFVVQFRAGAEPNHFAGRVEHMTSGQAARFSSPEELLAFLTRVLTQMPAEPPHKP